MKNALDIVFKVKRLFEQNDISDEKSNELLDIAINNFEEEIQSKFNQHRSI